MTTESRPELAILGRFFVVGVPRSGTTLLQSLLTAHSKVTSFTESHFFSRHYRRLPFVSTSVLKKNPTGRLREFLSENEETSPESADWFETGLRSGPLLPFESRRVARQFVRVLDDLALRREASYWVEKTPRHLHHLGFLELACASTNLRFVHILRRGVDAVASLHKASQAWERPYDLDTCVRRWNADMRISLERADHASDAFVCYEDLTRDPEVALRGLLLDLGLEWEEEILARYAGASEALVTAEEAWKKGVGRAISASTASGQTLSEAQRERVQTSLENELYDELTERTHRLR